MKIQHLIPILFLAAFSTVNAQTNSFGPGHVVVPPGNLPHRIGTVRYPDSKPAAGVHVTFYPGGYYPDDDDYNYHEAISDKNGHYDIIPPKKESVLFDEPFILTNCIMARDLERNYAAVQAFPIETTNVDLVLQPAITLSGSVEDTEHAPVSGEEIIGIGFLSVGYAPEIRPPFKANGRGQFSIPALPQGTEYWVWGITAKGYGSGTATVKAKDTQTNHYEFPAIVVKRANRILAGQVIGANGKPFPGVTVKFSGKGQPIGTKGPMDWTTTNSDALGRFIFNEVCDGEVQISAVCSIDSPHGNTIFSPAPGVESYFQAGDTNIVLKVIAQNHVPSSP